MAMSTAVSPPRLSTLLWLVVAMSTAVGTARLSTLLWLVVAMSTAVGTARLSTLLWLVVAMSTAVGTARLSTFLVVGSGSVNCSRYCYVHWWLVVLSVVLLGCLHFCGW